MTLTTALFGPILNIGYWIALLLLSIAHIKLSEAISALQYVALKTGCQFIVFIIETMFKAWTSCGLPGGRRCRRGRHTDHTRAVHQSRDRQHTLQEPVFCTVHVYSVFSLTCAVHGGGVSTALGLSVPPEPDVAILAPARTPAVPHNPVVAVRVGAVAHKLDSVVESDVGGVLAAVIDTAVVSSPATKSQHSL